MRTSTLAGIGCVISCSICQAQQTVRMAEISALPAGEFGGTAPILLFGMEQKDGNDTQAMSCIIGPLFEEIGDKIDASGAARLEIDGHEIKILVNVTPEDFKGQGDPNNKPAVDTQSVMLADYRNRRTGGPFGLDVEEDVDGQQEQNADPRLFFWPWWIINYEDGSVGAEGTQLAMAFLLPAGENSTTSCRRFVVRRIDGGRGRITLPSAFNRQDPLWLAGNDATYDIEWHDHDAGPNLERTRINGVWLTDIDEVPPARRYNQLASVNDVRKDLKAGWKRLDETSEQLRDMPTMKRK